MTQHRLLVYLTETITLEKIYQEIRALHDKIESLERLILPMEDLDPEELSELSLLKEESERDRVPWMEIKNKVEELIK